MLVSCVVMSDVCAAAGYSVNNTAHLCMELHVSSFLNYAVVTW